MSAAHATEATKRRAELDRIGNALIAANADSTVQHIAQQLKDVSSVKGGIHQFLIGARRNRSGAYVEAAVPLAGARRSLQLSASALSDWSAISEAGILVLRGDYASANRLYDGIAHRAATNHERALAAHALWGRALSQARQGRPADALRDYQDAAAIFKDIGERANEGSMVSQAADVLFQMGRDYEAFESKIYSLAAFDERRDSVFRTGPLMALGRQATATGLPYAARAVLREATESARKSPRSADRPEAVLRLVAAEFGNGSQERVRLLLSEARAATMPVKDSIVRARLEMELMQTDARLAAQEDPRRGAAIFDQVAAYFRQRDLTFSLPAPLLESARLRLSVADTAGAERNLAELIGIVETQAANAKDAATRRSMRATRGAAYDILTAIHFSRADTTGALLLAERGRGNALAIVPRTGPEKVVLAYSLLESGSLVWIVSERGLRAVKIPATVNEIRQLAVDLENGIKRRNPDVGFASAGHRLYELLISPAEPELAAARSITIVANDAIQRLPFAALRARDGRFLVERTALTFATSIQERNLAGAMPNRWVIVADPTIDERRFPDLPQLAGARKEAQEIRAIQPGATMFVANDATKGAIIASLVSTTAFHFAGHARITYRAPALSHLVLAKTRNDVAAETLTAAEIEKLDLRRLSIVVLSSCGTAQPRSVRDASDNGLSAAFLRAGTQTVVSSVFRGE